MENHHKVHGGGGGGGMHNNNVILLSSMMMLFLARHRRRRLAHGLGWSDRPERKVQLSQTANHDELIISRRGSRFLGLPTLHQPVHWQRFFLLFTNLTI